MSSIDFNMPNTEQILLLLEELCSLSYPQVQQKLNKYIQTATGTKLSFLIPILVESEEMVIHVIGEKILDRELRFPFQELSYIANRECLAVSNPQIEFIEMYIKEAIQNKSLVIKLQMNYAKVLIEIIIYTFMKLTHTHFTFYLEIKSHKSSFDKTMQLIHCKVSSNVLRKAIQNRKPTTMDITMLDEELLHHLQPICPVSNSFLTIPIQHPKQNHIALLVSLIDNDTENETTCKCAIVQECFKFCLRFLLNSFKCYEETRLKHQCQRLLAVSRKLFIHLGDFSDLLREIMAEARNLTNAERCSLFLLDPDQQDLVAKVFDGIAMKESVKEMRIPIGQGIAGHVATTGKVLNIRNAYEHPLFYRGVDEVTGFRTRNILCFPIRDESGIVGVAQLCNKKDGLYFDVFDEEVATAFSIYCGISIMHSIVYKKMQDAQARNKLSNEIMMYHMKVEEDVVQEILGCKDEHNIKDFNKFEFSPRGVPYKHMPCYTIKMFNDLGLINYWKLKLSTLTRFILYVKKGYRDAPYHNWIHAFSVAHFGYLLIQNLNLINENYMTHLEALVFLVSCLCHDIDHRGTNNAFQTKRSTVLASLYSSEGSVMERHHFAQTMCILNKEGCNIFENVNSEEYSEALDLLKNNILATDLACHFRTVGKQEEMVRSKFDQNDSERKRLFLNMLMTCCDLSDQTKQWKVSKKTAEQIYDEFFSQGDLEKSMGSSPIEMMDRERASIPDLQVQFITNIVLPLFINLSTLFPMVQPLVDVLKENRTLWEVSKSIFQKYMKAGTKGIAILLDPTFEEEVLQLYAQSNTGFSRNSTIKLELNETTNNSRYTIK